MSGGTSLLIALVLWADGSLRHIRSGSLVVEQVLEGPWRIKEVVRNERWLALARWPAVCVSVVVTDNSGAGVRRSLISRLQIVRMRVRILRIIGVTICMLLVLVGPWAVAHFGSVGLMVVGASTLCLDVVCATLAYSCAQTLGRSARLARRFAAPFLWPFSAPYAAERVLTIATEEAQALDAARALLSEQAYLDWLRPHAFDVVKASTLRGKPPRSGEHQLMAEFSSTMSFRRLSKVVERAPSYLTTHGGNYCPRCGAEFDTSAVNCMDCDVTPLRTVRGEAPSAKKAPRRRRHKQERGQAGRRRSH